MNSHRRPDWSNRFTALIMQHQRMPFAWGVQDCCQFGRKGIIAVRGKDPAKRWKLRPYKTARGALGQLKRLGGIEQLPARAGLEEIALTYAQRGDLILGEVKPGELSFGICTGYTTAYAGEKGLAYHPTISAMRAWRV